MKITKQDLIDDYNNNHKPSVECEPILVGVYQGDANDLQGIFEYEAFVGQPLVSGVTKLYLVPPDAQAKIAELEAKNAELIEALENVIHPLRLCHCRGELENILNLLTEMKKG